MAKTVKDLVEHMNKYKDTIFIVGPGILTHGKRYTTEEFNECYTRRNLVRDSDKLWNFFMDKMYETITPEEQQCFNIIKSFDDVTQIVINQNTVGDTSSKMVNLHGLSNLFICHKCKTYFTSDYITSAEPYECECELCGGTLRPTALLSGERYVKLDYDRIVSAFENTHTIILVGMDYTEESLIDLISQYGNIKSFDNEKGEEQKMLVAIQSTEEEFDPNELAFCEFLVKDNPCEALKRLKGAF